MSTQGIQRYTLAPGTDAQGFAVMSRRPHPSGPYMLAEDVLAALAAQRRETIEECAKHCDERAIAYGRSCSVAIAEQRHEDASRNALYRMEAACCAAALRSLLAPDAKEDARA